jgi:hypothetical protein
MSINGQRLTSRSSIRFAGDAILVDYRPLSPPYVITAVGDGRELQTGFASTPSGAYLKSLGDNYSIPSTITTPAQVEVPRSPSLPLTYAMPDSAATGSPTPTPSTAPPRTTTPSSEASRS